MLATGKPTSLRCASHAREKYTTLRKKIGRRTLASAQGMRTQARGATRVGATQRRSARGAIMRRPVGRTVKEGGSKVGVRHTNNGREIKTVRGTSIVRSITRARILLRSVTLSFV